MSGPGVNFNPSNQAPTGIVGSLPVMNSIDPSSLAKLMLQSNIDSGSGFSLEQMGKLSADSNPFTSFILNQSMSQLNSIGQAARRSMYELDESKNLNNKNIPSKCDNIGYFDSKQCGTGSRCISAADCANLGGTYVNESICSYTDSKNIKQSHNRDCAGKNISDIIQSYQTILNDVTKFQTLAPSLDIGFLNTQIVNLRSRLAKLEEQKGQFLANGFGITVWQAYHSYAINILYFVGPLFAAVLITNTFYYNANAKVPNDIFWVYKLFYAFWAALWYPAVLLYGAIDPPIYRGLFPFFGTSNPTESPMPIFGFRVPTGSDDPIQSEKGRLLFRLFSIILFVIFLYLYVYYRGITPP